MNRLVGAAELLDGHLDDPVVLRDNLRDLRRANRLTGGVALSRRAVRFLAKRSGDLTDMSLLDVGTGGADIPVALLADARRHGRALTITAVDSRPEVLDAARAAWPGLAEVPDLTLEVGDGRALRYPDRSFEFAHASLVLHHLESSEAVTFLSELARVSRSGIVVNDLARGRFTVAGAWLLSRFFTHNAFSRHDAPLSARRAYTLAEALELVAQAGLRPVFVSRSLLRHRWAIAAVRR